MLRKITLFCFLIFAVNHLYAIKDPIKFGKVAMDELLMKTYEKDTSAAAIYLCDYGVSEIMTLPMKFEFNYTHTRIIRIKILKKEGVNYGDLKFSYNTKGANITTVKGCTYNLEDGKIVKTKISAKDRILERSSDDVYTYKLACENVKVGSVVEFMYKISSGIPWSIGPWNFQSSIPTLWSEFRFNVPEYFSYKKNGKGYLAMDVNELDYGNGTIGKNTNFSINRYRFAIKDAPAFKKEPYITTSKNYVSAIEFEIEGFKDFNGIYYDKTGSWEKINKELMESEYFGSQLNSGGFLKDVVAEINANASTDKEKIVEAFKFIKRNMKWNEYYGKFATTSLRAAFKEKIGSVADINLMLVVLLNKLGIKADPVIISTRNNGLLSMFSPSLSKFNYVIASCKLDNDRLFFDATDENCSCNLLPKRCINDKGRLISKDGSSFVDIVSKSISKSVSIVKLNLSDDGFISGNMDLSLNGFSALSFRNRMQDKNEEEILEKMDKTYKFIDIESVELENMKDLEKGVSVKMGIEMSEEVEVINDLIYFNPFVIDKIKANPFTLEERKYPVDFAYRTDKTFMLELTVPEGYVLENIPTPARMSLPGKAAQYIYSVNQMGNKISVVSRFKINKRTFLYNEYANLKEFYNLLVAKNAEMLVLKKI